MTYSQNAPFRADVVGSYLRPAELKKARADFAAGKIDKAALKAVEDKAIIELVAKQKAAGLHVITDGEFRRGWWHLDCMWGFAGVEKVSMDKGYFFHDEETRAESVVCAFSLPMGARLRSLQARVQMMTGIFFARHRRAISLTCS